MFVTQMVALPSEVEDLLHLDERKNPKTSKMSPSKLFNDRNLKCLGKGEENGVSTPYLLSLRPYAHIQAKHAKKGLLVKTCHFTPLGI